MAIEKRKRWMIAICETCGKPTTTGGHWSCELGDRRTAVVDAASYDHLRAAIEAEIEWLRTPGHVCGEHAMADRLSDLLQGGTK